MSVFFHFVRMIWVVASLQTYTSFTLLSKSEFSAALLVIVGVACCLVGFVVLLTVIFKDTVLVLLGCSSGLIRWVVLAGVAHLGPGSCAVHPVSLLAGNSAVRSWYVAQSCLFTGLFVLDSSPVDLGGGSASHPEFSSVARVLTSRLRKRSLLLRGRSWLRTQGAGFGFNLAVLAPHLWVCCVTARCVRLVMFRVLVLALGSLCQLESCCTVAHESWSMFLLEVPAALVMSSSRRSLTTMPTHLHDAPLVQSSPLRGARAGLDLPPWRASVERWLQGASAGMCTTRGSQDLRATRSSVVVLNPYRIT